MPHRWPGSGQEEEQARAEALGGWEKSKGWREAHGLKRRWPPRPRHQRGVSFLSPGQREPSWLLANGAPVASVLGKGHGVAVWRKGLQEVTGGQRGEWVVERWRPEGWTDLSHLPGAEATVWLWEVRARASYQDRE